MVEDVRDLARIHAVVAVETLAEIMRDATAPPAARITAATALLDRGYGRPAQQTELSGSDGDPIESAPVERRAQVRAPILAAFEEDIDDGADRDQPRVAGNPERRARADYG